MRYLIHSLNTLKTKLHNEGQYTDTVDDALFKVMKGWDGRELMKDARVYISADGTTYRYLINNANFESYIKVVKTDAESGKTIPYAGAGFQIYKPDGSLVTQTFTYPAVTTIDTFYIMRTE